jgi:hypothetical protein
MSIEKSRNVFYSNSSGASIVSVKSGAFGNRDANRSLEELNRQILAIGGEDAKTICGAAAIAHLREQSIAIYSQFLEATDNYSTAPLSKESRAYLTQFIQLQRTELGWNMAGLQQIAAANIATIVNMPTYIPPKKGFFNR